MNPFRSKKKALEAENAGRKSSDDSNTASRGRTFRRKKTQPEPKPEINLSTVLPPTDDFRTSLLMPNLSARFSMLREQDDPNTKIGKANDDSVLFPKRSSRLGLFHDNGLSDIAEVSSLSGSVRPPFAFGERTNSFVSVDGYGTDDDSLHNGSVMGRAKPGQGNKFFGGRQKVYKIPVGGSVSVGALNDPNSPVDSIKPMGKAVYDDDLHMSAFQSIRAKEKAERMKNSLEPYDDREDRSSKEEDRNTKRETSSSTNSNPMDGRTSTAATSVTSQSASPMWPPPSFPLGTNKQSPVTTPGQERLAKGKRLYGQGLDQQIYDQQSSAMNRLNNIQQRNQALGNGLITQGLSQSRSATNLSNSSTLNGFRTASPTPGQTRLGAFDFGVDNKRSRSSSRDDENLNHLTYRPLSPTMSPVESPALLAAAIDANDMGKATALGAFNKPKTQYNEQQFAQRQLQLQEGREGRETPPPRAFSRTDAYSERTTGRLRNDSLASVQSGRSLRTQQSQQSQPTTRAPSAASNLRGGRDSPMTQNATSGTFLAPLSSESESGSEPPSPDLPTLKPITYQSLPQVAENSPNPNRYAHDDEHPAFKNQGNEQAYLDITGEPKSDPVDQFNPPRPVETTVNRDAIDDMDSPTLPFQNPSNLSAGLNDLIRGHLRNDSNQSSIYPNSPPQLNGRFSSDSRRSDDFTGNSRDFDNYDISEPTYLRDEDDSHVNSAPLSPPPLSTRAKQILEQAQQLRNGQQSTFNGNQGIDSDFQRIKRETPWQDQMKGHERNGSSATQKEREEFANELADRRRQVQDKLKSYGAQDNSQTPSPENGSPERRGPFGTFRKNTLEGAPNKAMKTLGLGPGPTASGLPQVRSNDNLRSGNGLSNGIDHLRGQFNSSRIPEPSRRVSPGSGPTFRDRSIGADRREQFNRPHGVGMSDRLNPDSRQGSRQGSPNPNQFRGSPNPNGFKSSPNLSSYQSSPNLSSHGFSRPPESNNNPPMSYHPAGRSRKYSPPRPTRPDALIVEPASNNQILPNGRSIPPKLTTTAPGSYFPSQPSPNPQGLGLPPSPHPQGLGLPPSPHPQGLGFSPQLGNSPRPSPIAPGFSAHNTPPLDAPPSLPQPTATTPTMIQPATFAPSGRSNRKFSVNKQDISEPTFISGTSTVTTVDLPAGASLSNGMDEVRAEAPPVPTMNPRRRRLGLTTFGNKSASNVLSQSTTSVNNATHVASNGYQGDSYEERSTFSGDEGDPKPLRPRARLRKSTSDGGSLAAKARHQALMREMEVMPGNPMPNRI